MRLYIQNLERLMKLSNLCVYDYYFSPRTLILSVPGACLDLARTL